MSYYSKEYGYEVRECHETREVSGHVMMGEPVQYRFYEYDTRPLRQASLIVRIFPKMIIGTVALAVFAILGTLIKLMKV